jgi:hypothetical protein
MTSAMKAFLLVMALLTAILILMQLVMGQLIVSGRADLIKAHQHTGYTAVVLALVYVGVSVKAILGIPTHAKAGR